MERNQAFDLAKGIGIILVVWGHFLVPDPPLFKEIFLFHMPLFFIISGCFIHDEKIAWRNIFSRLKKLLFPVLFFSMFFFAIRFIRSRVGEVDPLYTLFTDFTIDKPLSFINPPLWFLIALIIVNIINFVLSQIPIKSKVFYIVIALTVSFIGVNLPSLPVYLSQSLSVLIFFFIGKTFKDYLLKPVFNLKIFICAASIFGLMLIVNNKIVNIHECQYGDNYLYYLLAGISGSVMVVELCKILPKNKIVISLGLNSLMIMCLHLPLRGLFLMGANVLLQIVNIPVLIYGIVFLGLLFFSHFSGILLKRYVKLL